MADVDAHFLEDLLVDLKEKKVCKNRLGDKMISFIQCSSQSGCQSRLT